MTGRKLFFVFFLVIVFQVHFAQEAHAYLDPGTGSYIFQVAVATVIGGLYAIKVYWQKIKTYFQKLTSKKDNDSNRR